MESSTIYPHSATLFAAISASIFTIIGVVGNVITILALIMSPKIRGHATTAFVLSLSVSDLLFCSFSLPLTAMRFYYERWIFGHTLCKIFPVIFYGNVAVSLLTMVGITLNRYFLIACNKFYSQIYKTKYIVAQLAAVWVISFLMLLPPILGIWGEMGLDEPTFSCTILKKNGTSIKKTLFLIGFLLPCIVITASYSCVYLTVAKQKRKLQAHRDNSVSKSTYLNSGKNKEDNKLTFMMVTIFVCFLICYFPLMLANVADDERNTEYPWLHIIASVMAWASGVINPIIYAASNRNYRTAYLKLLGTIKFWGEPISSGQVKSFDHSKNSKDFSTTVRSMPLFINNQPKKQQQTYSM